MENLSLYIHIPFCQSKCHYCSFNSYSGMEWLIPGYVEALVKEIRGWEYGGTVDTVYLGGGTPTMLDGQHLGAILEACGRVFAVAPDAEITIEANPGTISEPFLRQLRALGVNRLSLGVQSFDDRRLRELGRRHSASEALEAFGLARTVFDNVNIDLLYSLLSQTLEEWQQALEKALGLELDHISLYPLTVEEGTPLSQEIASGRVIRPDPDLAAEMFLLAETMLSGYDHYEISNWAGPGRRCRHNLTYWKNLPYLGFGAGAHSFFERRRFSNLLSPIEYVQRLNEADSPNEQEEYIGEALEMAETMILGLRLREGVNLVEFSNRFNRDAASVYGDEIDELVSLGLLLNDGNTICLANRGRLLGNQVFLRFLP
ncbi:MAG: radical SAM family heme chaperone HemW [Dehalococcoidia bacterium]